MSRFEVRMLRAMALGSALLASGAAADPWMRRGPAAGRGPATGGQRARPRGPAPRRSVAGRGRRVRTGAASRPRRLTDPASAGIAGTSA